MVHHPEGLRQRGDLWKGQTSNSLLMLYIQQTN